MKTIVCELLVLLIPVCNLILIPMTFVMSILTGNTVELIDIMPAMLASQELTPFYDALVANSGEDD